MRIIQCGQGSPEWYEARRGVPTTSQFRRILTAVREEYSKVGASTYIEELIADKAELRGPTFFTSQNRMRTAPMANGQDCEPEARAMYALERGCDVQQVGFCLTDDGRFGCSPDGLCGEDGGLELKCPLLKTQVRYLAYGTLPNEYKAQVHGALIVTGRKWWDFLSYAPGLDPLLIRVEPNEYTEKLREALERFWTQYMATGKKLAPALYPKQPA